MSSNTGGGIDVFTVGFIVLMLLLLIVLPLIIAL